MKKLLLVTFFISFLMTCTNYISGTNDETVTRSGAVIYEPDGKTPSVGATVKVFKENSTDGQYISRQTTDTNGNYTLQGLPKGTYNIWAEKDSFVTFQSSVFVSDSQTSLHNDTLKCPSSLTGIVGIQPQHDPRSVTIQVVGTDKYFNNTDATGRFIMKGMAAGKYTLLLKSTLPDYTPTTYDVTVHECSNDTLKDTIWLIYTGIPVVMGVTSSYDTVNGTVHLQWNKTAFRNFQEYAIYRDFYDSISLSVNPVAVSADTFFVDSIFKRSISSGKFSITDPDDYHFKYRIAIMNNSGKYGDTYKYVSVVAASPTKVRPVFSFTSYHLLEGIFIDTASINDTMRLTVKIDNPTRKLRNVSWSDLSIGTIVRSSILDTTSMTATDTCRYAWNTTGTKGIVCSVLDMAGTLWSDTLQLLIIQDCPIASLSTLTPVVGIMDTIKLHVTASDRFGHISKIEWDIGNNGTFIENTVFDTVALAPNTPSNNFLCIVRITDDDGDCTKDSIAIQILNKITDADGNFYHTIIIGNQEWTVENLRTTKYNDGSPIPLITDSTLWGTLSFPGYCYYYNTVNPDTIKKFGALYNWYAVDTKKLAPVGWHVPSGSEWDTMITYLIANGYNWDGTTTDNKLAKSLASKSDWNADSTIGTIGTDLTLNNKSGFSALPAGSRAEDGRFSGHGIMAYFWSSSEMLSSPTNGGPGALFSTLVNQFPGLIKVGSSQRLGLSVRLIKD